MKRPLAVLVAGAFSVALGACNLLIGVDGYEATAVECAASTDCPVAVAACREATCTGGACGERPRSLGSRCAVGEGTTCDGNSSCVKCLPQDDVPPELNTGNGCGGPSCTKCPDGQRCGSGADCISEHCVHRICDTLG